MKFLLDQNISYKVGRLLEGAFGEVKHVRNLGLVDVPDLHIWQYAKANGYTIITFDSDFIDLSVLKASLPKVIWLKFGNAANLKVANKLISNQQAIAAFIQDEGDEILFLEIN
jgi:predicted nuclease of predicted toxin-antitoxin system